MFAINVAGNVASALVLQVPRHGIESVLAVCGFGLVLGIRHATDADHLVALSTIVSKQRSVARAALIGSVWGIGHTVTIFLVGSLIILFGLHIPPRVGLGMEFCVGVMLVLLGLLNLTGLMQRVSHAFRPDHSPAALHHHVERPGRGSERSVYARPLFVGLVHGLAGSAAVALLVLSTIRDPLWATLYLLIFGVGTILGMMAMTAAVAFPLAYGSRRFGWLNARLTVVSGIVSLFFGLFLVYELGVVGGLFGAHPHWVPS